MNRFETKFIKPPESDFLSIYEVDPYVLYGELLRGSRTDVILPYEVDSPYLDMDCYLKPDSFELGKIAFNNDSEYERPRFRFTEGRHRTAALARLGYYPIPLYMDKDAIECYELIQNGKRDARFPIKRSLVTLLCAYFSKG
jgi:hypothetical protein